MRRTSVWRDPRVYNDCAWLVFTIHNASSNELATIVLNVHKATNASNSFVTNTTHTIVRLHFYTHTTTIKYCTGIWQWPQSDCIKFSLKLVHHERWWWLLYNKTNVQQNLLLYFFICVVVVFYQIVLCCFHSIYLDFSLYFLLGLGLRLRCYLCLHHFLSRSTSRSLGICGCCCRFIKIHAFMCCISDRMLTVCTI